MLPVVLSHLVGHLVLFLFLTEHIDDNIILYRLVLRMARATSSPNIPTEPHALSNLK